MVHTAQVIHRDIKADNILFHYNNGNFRVKIADFGTAKILSNQQLNVTALGTPEIMAPELLLDIGIADNKV
ncbi:MAG: hypothetical protein EZS28_055418 [Streblomastix strix]|uniref:Protein kinase domain-containing protein n=1 Tax=Streblomastix strix TaxID=222440 RepID=A0A5J4Q0T8_9EUKA|nr:MAG: hypothetical protein EZS28_055418 [Streblomastix strix]